jgi:hypothetical protein
MADELVVHCVEIEDAHADSAQFKLGILEGKCGSLVDSPASLRPSIQGANRGGLALLRRNVPAI